MQKDIIYMEEKYELLLKDKKFLSKQLKVSAFIQFPNIHNKAKTFSINQWWLCSASTKQFRAAFERQKKY